MTTKKRLELILGVLVPTYLELGAKKGPNKYFLGFPTITLV